MRRARALLLLAALALLLPYSWQVAQRAELRAPPPTPILTDRHGVFLGQLGHAAAGRVDYGYWAVDPVPDRVARAMLALEDRRFHWHPGIDPLAVLRALWQRASGQGRSGASTIAMQVARMQQPARRTLWAKAVEAGVAVAITARYGRDAVLAQYLRLVPYGNGSHGIGHAARWYFDKPVADLSWAEIALLAAVPQAPALHNPLLPSGLARAQRRGGQALQRLARQGAVTAAELSLAQAQLAALPRPMAPRRPDALHAVLRLRDMLRDMRPDPGDPRIRTRLDLGLQQQLQALARRELAAWRDHGAQQVAAMVLRLPSREVVAAIGSSRYADPAGGAIDFTRAIRSPGSTLKPFLYALALDRGALRPDEVLTDLAEGAAGIRNADGNYLGPMLPRQALANSRNVPATNLLRAIGIDATFRHLGQLGLHEAPQAPENFGLGMAIGALPTSLDHLLRAYAALAQDGLLEELDWAEGQPRAAPQRVLSPTAARLVTLFLADPQARLPSFPRNGTTDFPFAVALKTGTSQGYRDAWMVAWSRDWMVGVWLGRPDAGTMQHVTGARAAGRLAQAMLLHLHGSRPDALVAGGFPLPEGHAAQPLCSVNGRSAGDCPRSVLELLPGQAAAPAPGMAVEPPFRAWAAAQGIVPPDAGDATAARISIATPEHNSRLWRNPETPARMNRLVLRAVTDAPVPQLVWYVDGEPFAIAPSDQPVHWPLATGTHRFQARLPYAEAVSRTVEIVVE